MQTYKQEIEIDSDCHCVYYDENDELTESEHCQQWCWEDQKDYIQEFLAGFLEANNLYDSSELLVTAKGFGWSRANGYKEIKATEDEILGCLLLDGDFRIIFSLSEDSKQLTAQRFSHDEPMGSAKFEFVKVGA